MGKSNDFHELTAAWENTYSSLDSIEADLWTRLEEGARSARNDFHQPVVGTISNDMPSVRMVVLRRVWAQERKLAFHTDIRSPKVADLKANPSISLLFYHKDHRLQLRVQGIAVVDTHGPAASAAWENSAPSSRRCYLSTEAPGHRSEIPSIGFPETFRGRVPAMEETLPGREHFSIVMVQVQSVDWLWLNHAGHRRAKFMYREGGFDASWLVP